MSLIKVVIEGQRIRFEEKPRLYSGTVEVDEIQFAFCDNWKGYEKTASFYTEEDENTRYIVPLDNQNKAVIPHEVLAKPGKIFFGAYGTDKAGKVLTSAIAACIVGKGIDPTDGGESGTPPLVPAIEVSKITEAVKKEIEKETWKFTFKDGTSKNLMVYIGKEN